MESFRLDDVIEEEKILDRVLEMVYTMDELQDDDFDLAILKTLKFKHIKKSLKRKVLEVEPYSHVVKKIKKWSVFFLETCYLSNFIDS